MQVSDNNMVQTRSYNKHIIVLDFSYDRGTLKYRPMAIIKWQLSESDNGEHFLNSNERCDTAPYALAVALDEATSWIDKRCESVGSHRQAISGEASAKPTI